MSSKRYSTGTATEQTSTRILQHQKQLPRAILCTYLLIRMRQKKVILERIEDGLYPEKLPFQQDSGKLISDKVAGKRPQLYLLRLRYLLQKSLVVAAETAKYTATFCDSCN